MRSTNRATSRERRRGTTLGKSPSCAPAPPERSWCSGSATPSLESAANARTGKFHLLSLPDRVGGGALPRVRVVDMRMEARKKKARPSFQKSSANASASVYEKGEQTILFLNRRGYAASLQCPKCGYVAGCPNCSVSLTYHRHNQKLVCHICGHTAAAPNVCPEKSCRNPAIRYAGIGTERVEETLPKLFPTARIARMDSDSLKRKDDFRRILGDFRTGKIDILLGTPVEEIIVDSDRKGARASGVVAGGKAWRGEHGRRRRQPEAPLRPPGAAGLGRRRCPRADAALEG